MSTLRHRKSVKLDDLELLQHKTAKQRWSACVAFIFKRNKTKSPPPSSCSSSSSLATSDTIHSNPIEKPSYHYSVSLPPTPSSLSPPPRHIMTRQSLTPFLSTPILPPQRPRRSSVLRLSMDVEQRYSYTSSLASDESQHQDEEPLDDPPEDDEALKDDSEEEASTIIRHQKAHYDAVVTSMYRSHTPPPHHR